MSLAADVIPNGGQRPDQSENTGLAAIPRPPRMVSGSVRRQTL